MLYVLLVGAIVVIALALLPIAAITLWFLLPFLMVMSGGLVCLGAWPLHRDDPAAWTGAILLLAGFGWLLQRYD
jgi:hypothetical protein